MSSFSRTVPSSPPHIFFLPNDPRFDFDSTFQSRNRSLPSISMETCPSSLSFLLLLLLLFPRVIEMQTTSNESLITKLSRTKKRKRIYERIDERTFPRISTNLRENRRDFSLWKNFLGTRENLSPRSDLFGEGLDT